MQVSYIQRSPRGEYYRVAKTHTMPGRAASGGVLESEPLRATGVGPEFPQIIASPFPPLPPPRFLRSDVSSFSDRTSMKSDRKLKDFSVRSQNFGGRRPISQKMRKGCPISENIKKKVAGYFPQKCHQS